LGNDPLVSICCITYNHSNYIGEAIESFLQQKTTFPFEICIGEDHSNDKTREICIDFAKKYPNSIRLFLRSRNDVIYINGIATGRYNMVETLKQCRGKYIAICEGDDYWSNLKKLQKQYDFLKKEKLVGVFGKTSKYDGSSYTDIEYPFLSSIHNKNIIIDYDKLPYDQWLFAHTSTFFFKRFIIDEYIQNPGNNNKLFYDICNSGRVGFLNENMSVYRQHSQAISVRRGIDKKLNCNHYYNNYLFFKNLKNKSKILKPQIRYRYNYSIIALLGCREKTTFYEKTFAILYFLISFKSNKYFENLKFVKKRLSSIFFHGGAW